MESSARAPRLRTLTSFLLPHRRTLLLGLLLGLAANAAGLATPMVTKWVLDTLGTGASMVGPIGVLFGLVVVGAAIGLWQWRLLGALAEHVVLDARASVVRHYFRARVGELHRRPTGELVTRATSDTQLLREASGSVVGLVNAGIALVGTLVLMGVLDLFLLGCTIVAVLVVAAVMGVLMPRIAAAQAAAQESMGRLGGALEGALRAVRTVKASRAEARVTERLVADAQQVARHSVRSAVVTASVWTVSWTGIQLAVILILGVGAWRAQRDLLEISSLIAFLLYVFQLMGPITELTQNTTALQAGIAAAGRIREVETIPTEPTGPADAPPTQPPAIGPDQPVLVFRGVTARYGPDAPPAVRDVDLVVPRRGHTAIVGPSGAGKTTLFSLVLRFLEPERGEILLDGRPYASYRHDEVRARLAYVEQETPVVPGTIGDNIRFTHPDATDDEIRAVLRAVRLDGKIDSLPDGLDTELSSTEVSGGQRQRIALARAILRTPDVLLLDEATAQVDGLTEAALQECVRQRAADGAVVTIAHRLSTVLDADRIVVLEDGRVRAQGTHAELLAGDDLYRRLVEALRIAAEEPVAMVR
ncbi:ABC transporter ATP-binding protein [Micromonospora sagamiensis]|uniref:ABC-type multidrug transport system fused ATPase/permease subunit n=1 Tax=Micromonospora sagamiensis TaxID=47875 RepID=A0A562WHD2_9ACTN|nr:ABC transporter ATP-binding protein [Micromonospora sagamiensis]TWJ29595.1 ABC-type multidrug transport system fused ATPase/permease subunit [Micromonospora sagamiensis]BCL17376.1 putative ABC transporter ATP-binding protein [Micromonospora sagamiensis]